MRDKLASIYTSIGHLHKLLIVLIGNKKNTQIHRDVRHA